MTPDIPAPLRRGLDFEAGVRLTWEAEADGVFDQSTRYVKTQDGRRGYIDIRMLLEDDTLVAIVEVKDYSWDRMTVAQMSRSIRRIARQLDKYIDAALESGQDISAGVVFKARPTTPGRLEDIEAALDEYGISVAWEDETIEERRARAEDPSE